MTAATPARRMKTARDLAEKFGVSTRTVQRLVAEPRGEFESRAQKRQDEALALRNQGLSHAEVGKALGVSRHAAAGLVRRGRQRQKASETSLSTTPAVAA